MKSSLNDGAMSSVRTSVGGAVSPAPSIGTQIGTNIRRLAPVAGTIARDVVNTPVRNLEAGINVASTIPRQAGGVIRDAAQAAMGRPAPTQGQALAPVRLPRLLTPSSASAGAAAPAAVGGQPVNYSTGPSTRGRRTLGATPAAAASQGFNLQPGDTNTFTGADGVTRAVPGLVGAPPPGQPAPTAVATLSSTAPAVQATTRRTLDGVQNATTTARQQIGAGLNPMSDQGELMRRLEISQGSFKGSPSARAAVARALLGQMDALTGATAVGQQGANRVLEQGAGAEAVANESFVRRRLDADRFNSSVQAEQQEREMRSRAPRRLLESPAGDVSALYDNGVVQPLVTPSGSPYRRLRMSDASQVTGEALLKSYTDRLAAIEQSTSTAAEKAAQIANVNADPLYASLRAGANGSAPYPDGTRLTGPGGRAYVVRNGQPIVLE